MSDLTPARRQGERFAMPAWSYALIAVVTLMMAGAFAVLHHDSGPAPRRLPALAGWVEHHPADWFALAALTGDALDSDARDPVALWRRAYRVATAMAPARTNARTAFVQTGLLHWVDLPPNEQKYVLHEAAPLLHDPSLFSRIAVPLFELTGDLDYLRKNNAGDAGSLEIVERLAANSGRFELFRAVRADIIGVERQRFESERNAMTPAQMLAAVPGELTADDQPLVALILATLHAHPLDDDPGQPQAIDRLTDFALRRRIEPLDGLEVVTDRPGAASDPIRARLALHFGDRDKASRIEVTSHLADHTAWTAYYLDQARAEATAGNSDLASLYAAKADASQPPPLWNGLCEEARVCTRADRRLFVAVPAHGSVTFEPEPADSHPYFELLVNGTRIAEGDVTRRTTVDWNLDRAGVYPMTLRVVDPFTQDGRERRLRIVAPLP